MAKKSLIEKLKDRGEEFLGNAKCNFGYYVARPLICGGLIAFAGIQLADQAIGRYSLKHETSKSISTEGVKAADIYKNMSPSEAIKYVDNYDKAKDYVLNHIKYEDHKGQRSFEETHSRASGICRDAAHAGVVLLKDNMRYITFFLSFEPKDANNAGHAVTLIKDLDTNKFGSLGINKKDCIEPTKNSLREVYEAINKSFSNEFAETHCNFAAYNDSTNICRFVRFNLKKGTIED